jgi:hypothetical protein
MLFYNERANCVGQMGIRTPCNTTMKEQNYVPIKLQKHRNDLTEITAQSIHNFALSL